jgi:hypothetical protein
VAFAVTVLVMGLLRGPIATADEIDSCLPNISSAEKSEGIPDGLLKAIGLTESGRVTSDGRRVPWRSVNAHGQAYYFDSKKDAVAFVQELQSQGVVIIDVGCVQVNLYHHPNAFASLSAAFDPGTNVAYAAKFLAELESKTGDWSVATQYYHSHTPYLGQAYADWVALNGSSVANTEPIVPLSPEEKAALRTEIRDQMAASDELIARSPARRQP